MNKPRRLALLVLAGLLAGGATATATAASQAPVPAADPRQALHRAFVHNLALKSYKASMTDLRSNRPVSTVEFQAPILTPIAGGGAIVVAVLLLLLLLRPLWRRIVFLRLPKLRYLGVVPTSGALRRVRKDRTRPS